MHHTVLDVLGAAGHIDGERASVDVMHVRTHQAWSLPSAKAAGSRILDVSAPGTRSLLHRTYRQAGGLDWLGLARRPCLGGGEQVGFGSSARRQERVSVVVGLCPDAVWAFSAAAQVCRRGAPRR